MRQFVIGRRVISILLVILMMLAVIPFNTSPIAYAAADAGVSASLKYISKTALPSNITLTNTNVNNANKFTPGSTYPMLVSAGGATTSLSIVTQAAGSITATIPNVAGLVNGTYEIRVGDPNGGNTASGATYFNAGNLVIADPNIASVTPQPNLALGYSALTDITVRGQYTNWTTGQVVVEVINSGGTVVQTPTVKSLTTVDDYTKDLVFTLGTGLSQGSYKIRVSAGNQTITTSSNAIIVRGQASVAYSGMQSLSLNEGYSTQTLTLAGTNTAFVNGTTTVTVLDNSNGNTGKASAVNVVSGTSLSFSLANGLTAGTYTIKVKTDVEEATIDFTVNAASAGLYDSSGNNVINAVNRQSATVTYRIKGVNTAFAAGTSVVELVKAGNVIVGGVASNSVNSTTSIDAVVNVNQTAATGYSLRVTTGTQIVQTPAFEIKAPATPTVTYNSIVYDSGNLAEGYPSFQVTVKGDSLTNFNASTTASIGGQTPTVTLVDGTEINFNMPTGLTQGAKSLVIDIDGAGGTTFDQFTYPLTVTKASISSIAPNTLVNASSTPVTISVVGVNSHFDLLGATLTAQILDGNNLPAGTVSNVKSNGSLGVTFDVVPNSLVTVGTYTVNVKVVKGSYTEDLKLTDGLTVSSAGISTLTPSSFYRDDLANKTIAIVGTGTSFDSNDLMQIDAVAVSSKTITDATHASIAVPSNLTAGTHTIRIVDGLNTYTSTFVVIGDRTISTGGFTTPMDYTSGTITATAENIDFLASTSNIPTVTVAGQSVAVSTTVDSGVITFPMPLGLGVGAKTVDFTWSSGVHSGLHLTTTVTVTNRYNELYLKKDGNAVTTLTVNVGATEQLAIYGIRIGGGADEAITTKAVYAVGNGDDEISISSSGLLTALKKGTATFTATYDGQVETITVTVNRSLSAVYFKVANADTVSLNKFTTDPAVTLQIFGTSSTNGAAMDVSTDAVLTILTGSDVVSLAGKVLSYTKAGTASIRATAEGVSADLPITITVKPVVTETTDSGNTNFVSTLPGAPVVEVKPVERGDVEVKAAEEVKAVAAGGTLNFEKVEIKIEVPANAFKEGANIVVETVKQVVIGDVPSIMLNKKDVVKLVETTTTSKLETVGEVYNFNTAATIEKPLEVTFKFDKTKVTDPERLGVYYYNPDTADWEYVGGKVDLTTGSIMATLKHFSLYSVMVYNKTFTDITNHWAKDAIEDLASVHIAAGINDQFLPNQNITRGEFTTMLIKALALEPVTTVSKFKDVAEKDWYKGYIMTAVNAKIVSGYGDTFKPMATITREEMAVMISKAYQFKLGAQKGTLQGFKDKGSISSWAQSDVALVNSKKIINGYPDNSFKPKNQATRAESVVMLKALRGLLK